MPAGYSFARGYGSSTRHSYSPILSGISAERGLRPRSLRPGCRRDTPCSSDPAASLPSIQLFVNVAAAVVTRASARYYYGISDSPRWRTSSTASVDPWRNGIWRRSLHPAAVISAAESLFGLAPAPLIPESRLANRQANTSKTNSFTGLRVSSAAIFFTSYCVKRSVSSG